MRKRFRGNQPIGVSQDLESHVNRGQLYAGGGTLWDVKRQQQQQQEEENQEKQQNAEGYGGRNGNAHEGG